MICRIACMNDIYLACDSNNKENKTRERVNLEERLENLESRWTNERKVKTKA